MEEILNEVPKDFKPPIEETEEKEETKRKRGRPKGSKKTPKINPVEAEAEFILQMFNGIKLQIRGEELNSMLAGVWKNSYIQTAEKYGISMNSRPELVFFVSSIGLIVDSLGTQNTLSVMDKVKIKIFTVFQNLKKVFRRNNNENSSE